MGRKVSALHLESQGCAVLVTWLGTRRIVFLGRLRHHPPTDKKCLLCAKLEGSKRVFGSPLLRGSGPLERKHTR